MMRFSVNAPWVSSSENIAILNFSYHPLQKNNINSSVPKLIAILIRWFHIILSALKENVFYLAAGFKTTRVWK